jgi:Methyltransferase TYW3
MSRSIGKKILIRSIGWHYRRLTHNRRSSSSATSWCPEIGCFNRVTLRVILHAQVNVFASAPPILESTDFLEKSSEGLNMSKSFVDKKKKILEALSVSPSEYADLSPKGSVDEGIRDLIDLINSTSGLVTTSSCAGRVSVYVEGQKKDRNDSDANAGQSGKGGGRWIFVSHDPLDLSRLEWSGSLLSKFELQLSLGKGIASGASLVHIKFEPMVSFALRPRLKQD